VATVLVVEDDVAIANLVDANLRKEGHTIIHARSVGEAWQEITEHPVTGAVVDLHLPGVYGWELVRRMRQDPKLRNVPVLIVSADLGEAELAEAEELGCDSMAKPFDLTEFLVKARTMIQRGLRTGRTKVHVKLLMDAFEIEGDIHVESRADRFSDAWAGLVAEDRPYVAVTDATIKTIVDGRVIDSPAFVQVNKVELRAVTSLEPGAPTGGGTQG
jgi:DNA-binding response OmpR family regulator